MAIRHPEAFAERASNLGAFNGIKRVLVEALEPAADPTEAVLDVHFYNDNELASIVSDPAPPHAIFPITGGQRVPAGPLDGQVQVTRIEAVTGRDDALRLTVTPIGDYSTYTLAVEYTRIDPFFSEVDFKFRPGCFNNCPPDWPAASPAREGPAIDYLAKDYDAFRHALMSWMMERVPGWQPTSEADLDQVLLDLFSAAADELSDYQDRVMNEAYLATARKRVSLARHARLMDYHIHQGNQARTWLVLTVDSPGPLPLTDGFLVSTEDPSHLSSAVFMTEQERTLHPLLNRMGLYTWSGAAPALEAGATRADLLLSRADGTPADDEASALAVRDLIRDGTVRHLVIQEHKNPRTGQERGRDPSRRQLLRLLDGEDGAEAVEDPVAGRWLVGVQWRDGDRLQRPYCFTVDCPGGETVEDVSLFHGNLAPVVHGRPQVLRFLGPHLPLDDAVSRHYDRKGRYGTICPLPDEPLAYRATPPGGEVPPMSTLQVEVEVDGVRDAWDEVASLVHSDDSEERGDHFVVETDEERRSRIRFGNGVNGRELPEGAIVHCRYQAGHGTDGNVGADVLTAFDRTAFPQVTAAWNPFDVTNGRAPEPRRAFIRRIPEAYRYRQLRAVTLKDYVDRAEELPDVARAVARYQWTGSWRTVRVAVDPAGTTYLSRRVRQRVARHLDAVRLIGEDLEIRPPRFVPLQIDVTLCVHGDYWRRDVRFVLEQEFSTGYTPGGRPAFFHPDRWSFGQALHASQLLGRIQSIEGIDHVVELVLQRWNAATPGPPDRVEVAPNEIILVESDPDSMERGRIEFHIRGGRS